MGTNIRELLSLEAVLVSRLQKVWARQSKLQLQGIEDAVAVRDWPLALRLAEAIDLSDIGQSQKELAYTIFRGCIDFGAHLAAGGASLTSGLIFEQAVKNSVSQWLQEIEWSVTAQVQQQALQSLERLFREFHQQHITK